MITSTVLPPVHATATAIVQRTRVVLDHRGRWEFHADGSVSFTAPPEQQVGWAHAAAFWDQFGDAFCTWLVGESGMLLWSFAHPEASADDIARWTWARVPDDVLVATRAHMARRGGR